MGASFDRAALATVDAAYRLEGSTADWLRRILACARPALVPDRGLIAGTLSATSGSGPTFTSEIVGTEDVPAAALDFVGANARERTPEYVEAAISAPRPLDTSSAAYHRFHAPLSFLDFAPFDPFRKMGVQDHLAAHAYDASGHGCILLGCFSTIVDPPAQKIVPWGKVMAHLCAGLRLRRELSTVGGLEEAVVEPGGRVVHAESSAKDAVSREALREAALRIERARSKAGRRSAAQALSDWTALVAGRWSLLETFESDGRRYLVARRNDPRLAYPRVLSERERQVAAYAARGHSNKYIAYVLGLAPSTVSSHLSSALRRLGARSTGELAALIGAASELPAETEK